MEPHEAAQAFDNIDKNLKSLQSDFKELKTFIVGNAEYKQGGIIGEIQDLKRENNTNKRAIERLIDAEKEQDQKEKNSNFKKITIASTVGLTAGYLGKGWLAKALTFVTQFWK